MSPEDIEALNNGHQEIARQLPGGTQPLPSMNAAVRSMQGLGLLNAGELAQERAAALQAQVAANAEERLITSLAGDCGHHYVDSAGEPTERWPKFKCALCDREALFSNGMCAWHRDEYSKPRYQEPRWLRVLRWLVR